MRVLTGLVSISLQAEQAWLPPQVRREKRLLDDPYEPSRPAELV
jgi:hypothetical protein